MNNKGRRGEVWLCEINNKKRPVLIVDKNNLAVELDRLVATVTSKEVTGKFDVPLKYWKDAGLDAPSIVRCTKINTIHYRELIFKIGEIKKEDLEVVLDTISSYFKY